MSILIFNAGMLAGAVLMWFGIHVGMRSRSNLDSQSAHWYGQWKAAAEAHVECDTMNMAEIERLRATLTESDQIYVLWRERAEAAEAERDRQRGAAEKHYARSESLLEQLTERDVELDRAVLKLAKAQAEVGRLEKAHAYSEASYFAAENALAAERAKGDDLIQHHADYHGYCSARQTVCPHEARHEKPAIKLGPWTSPCKQFLPKKEKPHRCFVCGFTEDQHETRT